MAKRIKIVGEQPRRVRVVDKPHKHVEPGQLAAALGAAPSGEFIGTNLDPITLAELGTQLQRRLRSTGGRPALADATEFCRVPLSPEDAGALDKLTAQIEQRTGVRPSPGQLASVIVHNYLAANQDSEKNERKADDDKLNVLPRLDEIASQANALRVTATALEDAVTQYRLDSEQRRAQ